MKSQPLCRARTSHRPYYGRASQLFRRRHSMGDGSRIRGMVKAVLALRPDF
ncbi:MAG TPA: hypothetical protein VK140_12105 [Ktedonobacteraceae bacterium]|nr:hypothetical protein [Ktedonobacteraceae bacterium]